MFSLVLDIFSAWSGWKPQVQDGTKKKYCLTRHRQCHSCDLKLCETATVEVINCTGLCEIIFSYSFPLFFWIIKRIETLRYRVITLVLVTERHSYDTFSRNILEYCVKTVKKWIVWMLVLLFNTRKHVYGLRFLIISNNQTMINLK